MFKLLIFILFLFSSLCAENFYVSVTVEGHGYKAKKRAKIIAKKEAIRKYILSRNFNISDDTINKIISCYSEYVFNVTLKDIEREFGKTTVIYSVSLDKKSINKKLEMLGESIQGLSVKLIIMEEPLDLNSIDFFSDQDFIIYYSYLQKRIKDIIKKKMASAGFKIEDIDNNNKFNALKDKEPNLTGVYFDYKREKYIKDKNFISIVSKEYPTALVIKYRLDFLTIINSKIMATLSFNIEDLETGLSFSLGSMSYSIPLENISFNFIRYSFSEAVTNIVSLMSNSLESKIDKVIAERNNMPIKVYINFPSVRVAYRVKIALKRDKYVSDIVLVHNKLKFLVRKKDVETYLYENLLPLLEDRLNSHIKDKFIFIKGKIIKIDISGDKFNKKNIKLMFI